MNTEQEKLLDAWLTTPSDKVVAQKVIALVRNDELSAGTLVHMLENGSWDETRHIDSWVKLYMDAIVCAGFHKSDDWWGKLIEKLKDATTYKALPVLVAQKVVRYVESTWAKDRPSTPEIRNSLNKRSACAFDSLHEILQKVAGSDPVTKSVLLYLSDFPGWCGEKNEKGLLALCAAIWPASNASTQTAQLIGDTLKEQMEQYVFASKSLSQRKIENSPEASLSL